MRHKPEQAMTTTTTKDLFINMTVIKNVREWIKFSLKTKTCNSPDICTTGTANCLRLKKESEENVSKAKRIDLIYTVYKADKETECPSCSSRSLKRKRIQ